RFSRDGVQTCALPIYRRGKPLLLPPPEDGFVQPPQPLERREAHIKAGLVLYVELVDFAFATGHCRTGHRFAHASDNVDVLQGLRSEERRVGKEGRSRM